MASELKQPTKDGFEAMLAKCRPDACGDDYLDDCRLYNVDAMRRMYHARDAEIERLKGIERAVLLGEPHGAFCLLVKGEEDGRRG